MSWTDHTPDNPHQLFLDWLGQAEGQQSIIKPNAMVLSTTNGTRVSSRLVLYKGSVDEGLSFYTNYDSAKCQDLITHPDVALCFHWEAIGKQIRVEGRAEKLPAKASDDYFFSRPVESQVAAVVGHQSKQLKSRQELEELYAKTKKEYEKNPVRPENWGGFVVKTSLYEFWQEGDHRLHDRLLYKRDSNWSKTLLFP